MVGVGAELRTVSYVSRSKAPDLDNPILVRTLAADCGVPDELTPAQAREIFATVRLVE